MYLKGHQHLLSPRTLLEKEEAARKAANVPLVGPVCDPFGSSGMSSSSAAPAFAVGSASGEISSTDSYP